MPQPPDRRALFCRLPEELHRALRIEAAVRGVPLGRLVEEALRARLAPAGPAPLAISNPPEVR